jgi:ribonucleoside-diphosphate reductase alpha chain
MQTEINQGGIAADASTSPREATTVSGGIAATAPGQLRVIKRNGTVVPFEASKISVAITKAFLAVEGGTAAASSRIHETVARLTDLVTATFKRRMPSGGTIHIEDVQDQVELSLMRAGEHKIAGAQTCRQTSPVSGHPRRGRQYHRGAGGWQPRTAGSRPPAHHRQ